MMKQQQRLNSPERASILIADEERLSREALGSVLWRRGHDVYIAEDGLSILTTFEQARPRLVILSLRWLGINGRAVLDELRAGRSSCGIIILCPDFNENDEMVNEVLQDGVLDILGKSTSLDRLLLAIDVGDILTAGADEQDFAENGNVHDVHFAGLVRGTA